MVTPQGSSLFSQNNIWIALYEGLFHVLTDNSFLSYTFLDHFKDKEISLEAPPSQIAYY